MASKHLNQVGAQTPAPLTAAWLERAL